MNYSNLARGRGAGARGAQFHCMTHLFWACQACSMAVRIVPFSCRRTPVIAGSEIFPAAWHTLRPISDHIRAPVIVPTIYQLVTTCRRCHKSDERLALSCSCPLSVHRYHSCIVWVFSCSCNCKRNEVLTGAPGLGMVVRFCSAKFRYTCLSMLVGFHSRRQLASNPLLYKKIWIAGEERTGQMCWLH